jgi:hypothetical protein
MNRQAASVNFHLYSAGPQTCRESHDLHRVLARQLVPHLGKLLYFRFDIHCEQIPPGLV